MAPIFLMTPPPSRSSTVNSADDYLPLEKVEQAKQSLDDTNGRWVKLPEALFSSIMAVEPEINPLYEESKALSEEWLREALRMSENAASLWSRLDIAYMSAISTLNADLETLKLMNDWNGWVFAFDDPFDEGTFADDPVKAAEEVISTLATLDPIHPIISSEDNPLRHTLQSCWIRFSQNSSPALQYRWKRYLTMYCIGVLQQVAVQQRASRPTVKEYMNIRAGCVGAYPCIGLMDRGFGSDWSGHNSRALIFSDQFYKKFIINLVTSRLAEGIDLPQYVMDHPSLEAISRITCDLITLQNDLLSYKKDIIKGEESNIIFIFKDQGLTDQQAVDQIGEMLYDCYRRWYEALTKIPFWGEVIDRDVMRFVNGCRNIALGNLHWSLSTFRYLGDDGPEVKRTRMMKLP